MSWIRSLVELWWSLRYTALHNELCFRLNMAEFSTVVGLWWLSWSRGCVLA